MDLCRKICYILTIDTHFLFHLREVNWVLLRIEKQYKISIYNLHTEQQIILNLSYFVFSFFRFSFFPTFFLFFFLSHSVFISIEACFFFLILWYILQFYSSFVLYNHKFSFWHIVVVHLPICLVFILSNNIISFIVRFLFSLLTADYCLLCQCNNLCSFNFRFKMFLFLFSIHNFHLTPVMELLELHVYFENSRLNSNHVLTILNVKLNAIFLFYSSLNPLVRVFYFFF